MTKPSFTTNEIGAELHYPYFKCKTCGYSTNGQHDIDQHLEYTHKADTAFLGRYFEIIYEPESVE